MHTATVNIPPFFFCKDLLLREMYTPQDVEGQIDIPMRDVCVIHININSFILYTVENCTFQAT